MKNKSTKQNNAFAHLKSEAKLARQAVIIEAAERVFAIKPFNKVSIRDIAREAGISHATIYRYFPDQQSLFVEAFLQGAGEITDTLKNLIEKSKTPDLIKISNAYVTYLMDNDQYFRMMTHFMLDGSLSVEKIEKLNEAERRCILRGFKRSAHHIQELSGTTAQSGPPAHAEYRPGHRPKFQV
ncbi:MAG: hypothetical protein CVU51_07145 [Deltaproteobacteria bacterium HGW-Deltaproteobacteria-1]|nr:MAG: hypothetical protein CVU51_07145 [Deltaproteobacteria bacterium HGW-Deltaproteobacteria-1]